MFFAIRRLAQFAKQSTYALMNKMMRGLLKMAVGNNVCLCCTVLIVSNLLERRACCVQGLDWSSFGVMFMVRGEEVVSPFLAFNGIPEE